MARTTKAATPGPVRADTVRRQPAQRTRAEERHGVGRRMGTEPLGQAFDAAGHEKDGQSGLGARRQRAAQFRCAPNLTPVSHLRVLSWSGLLSPAPTLVATRYHAHRQSRAHCPTPNDHDAGHHHTVTVAAQARRTASGKKRHVATQKRHPSVIGVSQSCFRRDLWGTCRTQTRQNGRPKRMPQSG
jgi:hypothetical protein